MENWQPPELPLLSHNCGTLQWLVCRSLSLAVFCMGHKVVAIGINITHRLYLWIL